MAVMVGCSAGANAESAVVRGMRRRRSSIGQGRGWQVQQRTWRQPWHLGSLRLDSTALATALAAGAAFHPGRLL